MKEGRRRDLNEVDFVRCGKLLEGVGAVEEKLAVDGGAAQTSVEFVEVLPAGGEIVRKEVGQRDNLRRSIFREGIGDRGSAVAAPEQTVTHGGVGIVGKCCAGFDEKHRGSRGAAGLNEVSSVHGPSF